MDGGLTRTDTLPYIDALSFRVPDAALGVQWPVEVELPNAGGVCDKAGHGEEKDGGGEEGEVGVGRVVREGEEEETLYRPSVQKRSGMEEWFISNGGQDAGEVVQSRNSVSLGLCDTICPFSSNQIT